MLTDLKIKSLKPEAKPYKVTDRDGLYITISPGGAASFRYDYRLNGRRETLTLGRYDESRGKDLAREIESLDYGGTLSLAEARLLLTKARRAVEMGESPAKAKAGGKSRSSEALAFGGWAEKFFEEADLADSTNAMRRAIYARDLKKTFGRMKLEEITPSMLMSLCEKIKKERNAPATAVHVREIVMQIFRFVQARGVKVANPPSLFEAIQGGTNPACPSVAQPPIGTAFPRENAIQVVQQAFKAGDTVFAPTVSTSLATVKAYGTRRSTGYGVLLVNIDENNAVTTTVGIVNDTRTFTASSLVYGKAQYDNSQSNVWTTPVSQSLGSVTGTFSVTLPPWSVSAITLTN